MGEGLRCFAEAKSDAQNASATAQLAFNISENAKQVCKRLSYELTDSPASLLNLSFVIS